MEMLDQQYQQYYAMTGVPPFDPTAPIAAAEIVANPVIPIAAAAVAPPPALVSPQASVPDGLAAAIPIAAALQAQPVTTAATVLVPVIAPFFTPVSMQRFIPVDEDLTKEYVRKQMYDII